MIDLLRNYNQLRNAPGYAGTIRYFLAKKKLDTLFIKWLSSHEDLVENLLKKAQNNTLKSSQQPNPLFLHHRIPINNSIHLGSSAVLSNTITPPRGPIQQKQHPQRKSMNQTHTGYSLNRSTLLPKTVLQEAPISTNQIPQFFFPKGKPIDSLTQKNINNSINSIIGQNKSQITYQISLKLVQTILGLPKYFSKLLIIRAANNPQAQKTTKIQFLKLWKIIQSQSNHRRAFWLLSSHPNKKYITIDDFKLFFKQILATHPGLQFLKQTAQFQDWYSLCVIYRMYYMANRKYDYKMTFRQFKASNILKSLYDIQAQPEINKNLDFFSYQDFYVIYIKFWELDNDHDFQLSRQQLSKYSGYTLSRKTLERIFSQTVKKFEHENKMGFGDFVWFILCVQDKTTVQSIQYWFKIMDLDGNGIITGYQLQYFYEEQSQRLTYMESALDFNFQNIVCQMVDVFKPVNNIQFVLDDFLKRKSDCSVFINMLTDLNKLIGFQQRDAYEERNVKVENPGWTDWDRFVKPEYRRIESAQQNDDGQVLNWEHDD